MTAPRSGEPTRGEPLTEGRLARAVEAMKAERVTVMMTPAIGSREEVTRQGEMALMLAAAAVLLEPWENEGPPRSILTSQMNRSLASRLAELRRDAEGTP